MRLDRKTHTTSNALVALVVSCLKKKQKGKCSDCKQGLLAEGFQITHKRYGEDINLNDLELKCGKCHAKEHGVKDVRGRVRKVFGY